MKKMVVLISAVVLASVVIGCEEPETLSAYEKAKVEKLKMLKAESNALDKAQIDSTKKKNDLEQKLKDMGNPPERIAELLAHFLVKIESLKKEKEGIQDTIKKINDAKTTGEKENVFHKFIKPNLEKRLKIVNDKHYKAPKGPKKDTLEKESKRLGALISNALNEFYNK